MTLPDLELLEIVGEGGMAVVWKARDLIKNRIVAVKLLKNNDNADDVKLFQDEARAMEVIRHPNFVKAYKIDCHEGQWYYVMEFVDGYNYADYMCHRPQVREEDCLLICASVASALDYAWTCHKVVHCDIKPDNIMINSEGIIKLTDLGLCHVYRGLKDGTIQKPEHVLGTPSYISPEQIYGDVDLDQRADIYSLAATLYHLSSGQTLFNNLGVDDTIRAQCNPNRKSNDPRVYNPKLSEGFAQLLEAMLIKDREARVQNWPDVIEMASHVARGGAFKPRPKDASPSSLRLI